MPAIFRSLFAPVVVLVLMCLGGCAFGTRHPTLAYPPGVKSDGMAIAHAAPIAEPRNVTIVLKSFTDQRADKRVVGTVRNAYGMRTADVVPNNDVTTWVTEAVKSELLANGYSVTGELPESSSGNIVAIVSGEILNVFCDMYFTYTGQVSLVVRVTRDDHELFNKHYAGEGSAGLAVAMTSEAYAQSLALALASALQQFVTDLNTQVQDGN